MKYLHFLRGYLLSIVLFLPNLCISQQSIVTLHPYVGDTITFEEAYTFYLFQDKDVKEFDYALVLRENTDEYKISFYSDIIRQVDIDSLQIVQYAQNIEKIYQFLVKSDEEVPPLANPDSLTFEPAGIIRLNLMTPEQKKKMIKDARLYFHKKLNADEQGLYGKDRDDYMHKTGGIIWGGGKKEGK